MENIKTILLISIGIGVAGALIYWLYYRILDHIETNRMWKQYEQSVQEQDRLFAKRVDHALESLSTLPEFKKQISYIAEKAKVLRVQQQIKAGAPVRALSWKEPFATMMQYGKIETRSWETKYRGLVLICSCKTNYCHDQIERISGWKQWERMLPYITDSDPDYLNTLGHAIAIGRLVDCRPMKADDEDQCFVKYHPDLWCHIYDDVVPIEPIAWKGKQGWSIVTPEFINQIKFK